MKILTISNCSLIESQGSGYAILNFSRGLIGLGHSVDLFGPEHLSWPFYPSGRANQYRQAIGILFLTLNQLRKKSYDMIEFYGAEAWLTILFLSIFYKNKYLIALHSNGIETHAREVLLQNSCLDQRWYRFNTSSLLSLAFKLAYGVVTVSEYDRNYVLEKVYQDHAHVVSIEHGLLDSFLGKTIDLSRQYIIGYCGSWIPRKGIQVIYNDISLILKEFPHFTFKLIGVGENFRKEEYFPNDVLDQVEVVPFIQDKSELKKNYQSISILVMPSIYESFGLVAAEAMACGCALVANKTGFLASLRNEEEAIILEQPTSPYLYDGVKKLILDDNLRVKIAQSGYARVQNLRWDIAIDKLEETYLKWLKEKQNSL